VLPKLPNSPPPAGGAVAAGCWALLADVLPKENGEEVLPVAAGVAEVKESDGTPVDGAAAGAAGFAPKLNLSYSAM
jgi:hypothetical protein